MRIKELIKLLQEIEKEHGDLLVYSDELGEPLEPPTVTNDLWLISRHIPDNVKPPVLVI